jgi:hypothetical protein
MKSEPPCVGSSKWRFGSARIRFAPKENYSLSGGENFQIAGAPVGIRPERMMGAEFFADFRGIFPFRPFSSHWHMLC